jgi:hypothetical protein
VNDSDLHRFSRNSIDALNERRLSEMDAFIHDVVLRNGKPSHEGHALGQRARKEGGFKLHPNAGGAQEANGASW